MKAISYTSVRANLAAMIEATDDSQESIIITRNGEGVAVLMSMAEYESLQETAYLLRSPKNAQRLLESIMELESGEGRSMEMGKITGEKKMNPDDISIQDLHEPEILQPSTLNRGSFIRGWNEAVNSERPGTVDDGDDNWRIVGWHAGNQFGEHNDEFRHQLFLWTTNQRRLALGLPPLDSLVNE